MTVLAPPTDRAWGERTLHVADPDGYVVEFTKPRATGVAQEGPGRGPALLQLQI